MWILLSSFHTWRHRPAVAKYTCSQQHQRKDGPGRSLPHYEFCFVFPLLHDLIRSYIPRARKLTVPSLPPTVYRSGYKIKLSTSFLFKWSHLGLLKIREINPWTLPQHQKETQYPEKHLLSMETLKKKKKKSIIKKQSTGKQVTLKQNLLQQYVKTGPSICTPTLRSNFFPLFVQSAMDLCFLPYR